MANMVNVLTLLICLLLLGIQILFDWKRKCFDVFNIKYAFLIYYIMILPLSGFLYHNFDPENLTISDSMTIRISFYVIIGIVCYLIGNNVRIKLRLRSESRWNGRERGEESDGQTIRRLGGKKWVNLLISCMIFWGYFMLFMLLRKFGGVIEFIRNIEAWRNTGLIGNGIYMISIGTILPMATAIYCINNKNSLKKERVSLWILVVLTVVPSVLLGFRGTILAAAFLIIVEYNYTIKQISIRKLAVFMSAAVIFLMLYSVFRGNQNLTGRQIVSTMFSAKGGLFAFFYRLNGYQVFGTFLEKMQSGVSEYQFGWMTIVEMLTILVPRSVWPKKPTPKSVRFSETFFNLNGGVSPTCICEMFWDFGFLGIIFGMILLGYLHKAIYRRCVVEHKSQMSSLVYASVYFPMWYMAEAISGELNGIWIDLCLLFVLNIAFKLPGRVYVTKGIITKEQQI